jgi:methionine aminotransferase
VIQSTFGRPVDPESEITITAGATESTYSAIAALISPGDEVIIFDPAYDSYNPVVRLNGGIPVHINLYPPDFAIPWDIVRARITPRTRMIIINTPHNPSGSVLQKQDLNTLQQIVEANNLLVLSDEVYERLVFDDVVHESVLRYPRLAERSLAVFSFGKTFRATGWKVGYVTAPADLTREIRKSHQFVTFAVNTPVQLALAEYLDNPEHYLTLGKFYQKKRDFFLDQIKGSSFEPLPCHGSYFQLLDYRQVAKKTEVEMCEMLTKKLKVASIPISVFYQDGTDNNLLRFCFAKKEETLEKACAILRKL